LESSFFHLPAGSYIKISKNQSKENVRHAQPIVPVMERTVIVSKIFEDQHMTQNNEKRG
jgi:hypothetical protein